MFEISSSSEVQLSWTWRLCVGIETLALKLVDGSTITFQSTLTLIMGEIQRRNHPCSTVLPTALCIRRIERAPVTLGI